MAVSFRRGWIKKISQVAEYGLIVAVAWLLRRLPYRVSLMCGEWLGFLSYFILGIRRRVALANLKRAFPQGANSLPLTQIAKRTYRNYGRAFVEFAWIPEFVKNQNWFKSLVKPDGLEYIKQAAMAKKGAILLSGHFGNWEILGGVVSLSGLPVDFVVKTIRNPYLDGWVNRYRAMMGVGVIRTEVAVREVLAAFRRGRLVAMLADQYAGAEGVMVNFLGLPSSTPKGPAAFALRTGAPCITGFLYREKDGHFRMEVEPLFYNRSAGDHESEVRDFMQRYSSLLEKHIRKQPDLWLWTHRRWKNLERLTLEKEG